MTFALSKRLVLVAVLAGFASGAAAQDDGRLKTPKQQYSYGMGLRLADMLLSRGITDLDVDAMALAVRDRYSGLSPRLGADELAAAYAAYQEEVAAMRQEEAERNAQEGAAFLARNQEREGVETLESGLQYLVHASGEGASPTPWLFTIGADCSTAASSIAHIPAAGLPNSRSMV